MYEGTGSAIVISDGGLASLLACWTEGVCRSPSAADHSSSLAWLSPFLPDPPAPRVRAAGAQADLAALPPLLEPSAAGFAAFTSPRSQASIMLLSAVWEAQSRGIPRVVWPIQSGPDDLDAIADACDKALLAAQLASLDTPRVGGRSVIIQTPYIDLSDPQMMDLAIDMGVPLDSGGFWECERAGDKPCGECEQCRRWAAAFRAAAPALADPLWFPVVTAASHADLAASA